MATRTFSDADHADMAIAYSHAALLPFSWSTIWQWAITYGLPVVVKVLQEALKQWQAGNVTVANLEAWALAALKALSSGQPLPPFPLPPFPLPAPVPQPTP